jgi:DNA-directed RNA polymerase specialized sigma24 family protein
MDEDQHAIKSFTPGRYFYTWLYKILKNLCINHHMRIKRRRIVFSDADETAGPYLYISPLASPEEVFEEHEMRDRVWKALMKLWFMEQLLSLKNNIIGIYLLFLFLLIG